jgi:hypothetical protein
MVAGHPYRREQSSERMAMSRLRRCSNRWRAGALAVAAGLIGGCLPAGDCLAYTAAGDRLFPATGILPQIAPGDEFYAWGWTVPLAGGAIGVPDRASNFGAVYDKMITERLGFHAQDSWFRLDRRGAGALHGFQNFETELKYLTIDDHPHEFLLSLGVNREWGGTGAQQIGAARSGATEPRIYFGKGLGDLDIGYLRPLAVTGQVGYQIGDTTSRPNLVTAGLVVEYSIPYLLSKVQTVPLPEFIRGLTPLTEVSFAAPSGRSFGARTTVLFAPGVSYAGEGWEFLLEALVPATRATGAGAGVRAQLHLSLDFLFPDTIGRPLLSER